MLPRAIIGRAGYTSYLHASHNADLQVVHLAEPLLEARVVSHSPLAAFEEDSVHAVVPDQGWEETHISFSHPAKHTPLGSLCMPPTTQQAMLDQGQSVLGKCALRGPFGTAHQERMSLPIASKEPTLLQLGFQVRQRCVEFLLGAIVRGLCRRKS